MRFLTSLVEQGMGSIITFGLNLWLIRNGGSESYGVYVFWYSVAWVLATCQFTLTVVHLSSLPSGADRLAERREPEQMLFTVTLLFLIVTALGVAGANAVLSRTGGRLDETNAVLFIPAFLLYQYVRAFAFSRKRVVLGACLTGSVMITSALGLAVDFWTGTPPDATRVLLIVGLAYGLCALAVLWRLDPTIRPVLRLARLRRYTTYLKGSGWLVLGAGSNEVTSRLYSFAVVDWFGPQALARLSAVQVVIRPAWMLSAAWMSLGFPTMATQHRAGDRGGLVTTMIRGALLTAAGSLVWSGAVIAGWPWISSVLYRGRYADVGLLAWFWGGNVLLGSIAVALNTAMLVMGEFRRLALIDLGGALVCCIAMALLLGRFDADSTVIATMIGQATQIGLMGMLLARGLGRLHAPALVAEP